MMFSYCALSCCELESVQADNFSGDVGYYHTVVRKLASESNAPFLTSPVVDEESMRPVLAKALCF